jgi:hypothetical protein
LRDAEGQLHARGVDDVLEVGEDALRRLGPQVGDGRGVGHGADVRLEHHVEGARRRQAAGLAGGGRRDERDLGLGGLGEILGCDRGERAGDGLLALEQLGGGLEFAGGVLALEGGDVADDLAVHHDGRPEQLVGAVALLAGFAVHERVAEAGDVAGGLPDLRVHDDGGLEADDIVTAADHVVPPAVADVFLELGAERAVVEETVEAAVDFGGRVDKAAALRERHKGFHEIGGFGGVGHGGKDRPQLDVGSSWRAKGAAGGRSRLGLVTHFALAGRGVRARVAA